MTDCSGLSFSESVNKCDWTVRKMHSLCILLSALQSDHDMPYHYQVTCHDTQFEQYWMNASVIGDIRTGLEKERASRSGAHSHLDLPGVSKDTEPLGNIFTTIFDISSHLKTSDLFIPMPQLKITIQFNYQLTDSAGCISFRAKMKSLCRHYNIIRLDSSGYEWQKTSANHNCS